MSSDAQGRVTIADIARQLGVSKSTVSYALNGKPGVGDAMRERILALATSMGFQRSSAARALSNSRASAAGLVMELGSADSFSIDTFFMRFLAGVENELGRHDLELVIRMVPDLAAELSVYERWYRERRVDGVILVNQRVEDARLPALARLGLPTVIAGPIGYEGIPAVWTDDIEGVTAAMRHLAELGHRRVATVRGPAEFLHTQIRGAGFRQAAEELSLEVVAGDDMYDDPDRATRMLLGSATPPTAILYEGFMSAVMGMHVAAELGVPIPDGLSVVGWDDSPMGDLVRPSLTVVHRDVFRYGVLSAHCLIRTMGGAPPRSVQGATASLRIRGSTGPART